MRRSPRNARLGRCSCYFIILQGVAAFGTDAEWGEAEMIPFRGCLKFNFY